MLGAGLWVMFAPQELRRPFLQASRNSVKSSDQDATCTQTAADSRLDQKDLVCHLPKA
jgi:hypothetical protein